jgi:hypothetical protein
VVKTFHRPRLIPKHLTGSEVPNCESSASGGHFVPTEEPAAVAGDLTAFFRGLS